MACACLANFLTINYFHQGFLSEASVFFNFIRFSICKNWIELCSFIMKIWWEFYFVCKWLLPCQLQPIIYHGINFCQICQIFEILSTFWVKNPPFQAILRHFLTFFFKIHFSSQIGRKPLKNVFRGLFRPQRYFLSHFE